MKIFNQKQLAIFLLCAIAVPFVLLAALLVTGVRPAFLPVSPALALHGLGVLCIGFFAGAQWGVHFCKRTEDSVYLFAFFLLVFAALSLLDAGGSKGLAVLVVIFMSSCAIEWRLSRQRVTTLWYWRTRCVCSLLIVLSLAVALAMSLMQKV